MLLNAHTALNFKTYVCGNIGGCTEELVHCGCCLFCYTLESNFLWCRTFLSGQSTVGFRRGEVMGGKYSLGIDII